MIDLTQFLSVGGLSALLMVLVQAFKPQIPEKYTGYIPYVVTTIGIITCISFALVTGNVTDANTAVQYGVTGLLAGLASVGLYQHTFDKLPSPKV